MYCTIHQRIGYHALYSTQQSRVDRLPCTVQYTRDSSNQVTMYSTVHNIGRVDRLPCNVQYKRDSSNQVTTCTVLTVHKRFLVQYTEDSCDLVTMHSTAHNIASVDRLPLALYSTQQIPLTWLPCTLQSTLYSTQHSQYMQTGYADSAILHLHCTPYSIIMPYIQYITYTYILYYTC